MGISIADKQVYSEIDEFLSLLPEKERNKLPEKLIEFFREEKDKYYRKNIDPNVPIKDQNLKEDTLAIIAFLNLKYWCESEEEKKRLQEIYLENDRKYEELMKAKKEQEKINNENIFSINSLNANEKNNNEKQEQIVPETKVEEVQLTSVEESGFKRFLNKIIGIFRKNKNL